MRSPKHKYTAGFDGSATPNPGMMKIGGWIKDPKGKVIRTFSREVGHGTNNIAEYMALVMVVRTAKKLGISNISIQGDSMLVINQVNGEWKTKDARMKFYKAQVDRALKGMKWELKHVLRKYNSEADRLT